MSASLAPKTTSTDPSSVKQDLGTPSKEWAANTQNALFSDSQSSTSPIATTTNNAAANPTVGEAASNTATFPSAPHGAAAAHLAGPPSNTTTPGHEMPGGWGLQTGKSADGSQLYNDVTNTISSFGTSALNAIQPVLPESFKSTGTRQQGEIQPPGPLNTQNPPDKVQGGMFQSLKDTITSATGVGALAGRHSGGVGDLPGTDSEVSVAKLPEEREHPDPFNEPSAKESHFTGGVGDLPGSASETGVAKLPEERANPDPLASHSGRDTKQIIAGGVAGGVGAAALASDPPKSSSAPKQALRNIGDKFTGSKSTNNQDRSDSLNISSPVSSRPIHESSGIMGPAADQPATTGFGGPPTTGAAFAQPTTSSGFNPPATVLGTTGAGFDGTQRSQNPNPHATGHGVDNLMGRHGTKGEKEIDSHIINTTGADHIEPRGTARTQSGVDAASTTAVRSDSPDAALPAGAASHSQKSSTSSVSSPTKTKVPFKDRVKGEMKVLTGKLTNDPAKVEEGKVIKGQIPSPTQLSS